MILQNTLSLNDALKKLSIKTSESFLINQYISNNFLNVTLESSCGEAIYLSINSPLYYLSDLSDDKILNTGSIYFLKIDEFLDVDESGYFKCKDKKNFHHIIAKNMMKIAIGLNCKNYSYLGIFKGYSILNAFLVGNENIKKFTVNNECILLLK